MSMHKAFRYRLEPTAEQEQKLRQFAGARRFIWNWALQQRRESYRQTGKTLPAKELSARLTALKDQPERAWLREMDSQLLQQVLADLLLSVAETDRPGGATRVGCARGLGSGFARGSRAPGREREAPGTSRSRPKIWPRTPDRPSA